MILAKRWVLYIVVIFLLVNFVLFLFNITIDPYGKQNHFCDIKYKPVLNERGQKYNYIFNEKNIKKYDSLILGSSRVMKVVPSNSKFTKDFYNFGVHVANNAEKLFLIEEWLKVKKLKKVYLGIDYYNFHQNKRPLYVDTSSYKNDFNANYLSIQTLKLGYKSLINKIKDQPITFFNRDGSINYFNKDSLIAQGKYDFSIKKFQNEAISSLKENMVSNPFVVEEKVFDILKQIKVLSIKYGFELYVFITPSQQEVFKELKNYRDLNKKFLYIDKKIVDIFGKVYKFYHDDKYNQDTRNFYDVVHYRGVLGDKIIDRLNGIGDYGIILEKGQKLNAL